MPYNTAVSEAFFKDLEHKNPGVAEATYCYAWNSLKDNKLPVKRILDYKGLLHLPQSANPRRKLLIPPKVIMQISELSDAKALETIGLSPRPTGLELIGNQQILSSIKDVSKGYGRYLNQVTPLVKNEIRGSRAMFFLSGMTYVSEKIVQATPFVPEFAQGRIVDFMAIPIIVSVYRYVRSLGMQSRLLDRIDYLSTAPTKETTKFLSAVDEQTAMTLIFCYSAEIAQGLHLIPGTFDIGDFVAYTAGGLLYWGLFKLRDRRIKEYLENSFNKKKKK